MKLGIVGSGKIVRSALTTLRLSENVSCGALCVRSVSEEKGKALAEEFQIPVLYTDYDRLLRDESVDFIYIGVVNQMHYEYAMKALNAGRNVILEKPFTSTAHDARQLAELARDKGVFLFEAIMNLYSPTFLAMKARLPQLGDIKLVLCNFSQYSSRYDDYLRGTVLPAFDPACSGGSLFDINIYNLHLTCALFGAPEEIQYMANIGFNGIDTSGTAVLRYKSFTAVCAGAKDSGSPGFAIVQGTGGYMRVEGAPSICASVEISVGGQTETISNPTYENPMLNEFEAFHKMWRENDRTACLSALDHTVTVMETAEAARKSAGIRFVNADLGFHPNPQTF